MNINLRDKRQCHEILKRMRGSFVCQKCGNQNKLREKNFSRICAERNCKTIHSITNGTIFHNVRFGLLKAFRIVIEDYNSEYELSSSQVARGHKIEQPTAWNFLKKIHKRKTDVEKLMTFMNEPKKKLTSERKIPFYEVKDEHIKKLELIEKNIMKLKIN